MGVLMEYKIIPGIAACVTVECEKFPLRWGARTAMFIYMDEGKPIEKGVGDLIEFSSLPQAVQDAITAHFNAVFALPIEARGKHLDSIEPVIVEVDE